MSDNIKKCEDGTYRWVYEFSMLKNPVIILTVFKIFVFVLLGMWLVFGLFRIGDNGLIEAYIIQTKELIIPAAILFVLCIVSYLILAVNYGFKYCVLFEMNEKGVRHIQMEKQFKKAQALGWLTAMLGAASGNIGAAGTGLLAASKSEEYSEFGKVKRMRSIRAFRTIKLDSLMSHNQIYAEPEDYDFVLNYISQRVPEKSRKH